MYAWIYQRKQSRNEAESYFMASKSVLWLAVGATLFSSNIGAEHFVGLSGSAAKSGMAVGAWEWTAPILLLIQGYFVAPIYISSGVTTTPEYLELRFNRIIRIYNAFITLIIYIFVVISSTLYAGSVILNTILGWSLYLSSISLIVATGCYVVLGGLRAVVYTENVQTIVLIIGGLLCMAYSLREVGGLSGIYDKYDQFPSKYRSQYMHLFRSWDDKDWPWPGITLGIVVQSYYYWCGNHLLIQRVLSAKSALHAKFGAITASFLKILPVFIMCIPGICAVLLYPEEFQNNDIHEYDRAYPMLVLRVLPNGLTGLVVAAMLSALMSSLAAVYNSASTIITNDIYKLIFSNTTINETKLVFIGRVSACVFICISLLWLPMIQNGKNELFAYTQAVSAYIQNPLSVIYFLGTFWNRANVKGAYCAIILGFIAGFIRFILSFVITEYCDHTIFCSMNFIYFGMTIWIICTLIMIVVSLLTEKPPNEKIDGLTYWTYKKIKRQNMNDALSSENNEIEMQLKPQKDVNTKKEFVELIDETESNEIDSNQSIEEEMILIEQHHGKCCSLIHLVGDEDNSSWNRLANILTVISLLSLIVCWIIFF